MQPVIAITEIAARFGAAAANYSHHASQQRDVLIELMAWGGAVFDDAASILDIGSGPAMLACQFPPLADRTISLDISLPMCRMAAAHTPAICADMNQLPFADASFDGVLSSLALQWSADMAHSFAQWARILRPGGYMLVSTYLDGTLCELSDAFHQIDPHTHMLCFATQKMLETAIASSGLQIVRQRVETRIEPVASATHMLRQMKRIGASAKSGDIRRGLMTPAQLTRLNDIYAAYWLPEPVSARWVVAYLMVQKI